jgi:hypothetical protein
LEQDNGTEYRQPIVSNKDRQKKCGWKGKNTFQKWIDVALHHYIGENGSDFRGICYENWLFVPKGIT